MHELQGILKNIFTVNFRKGGYYFKNNDFQFHLIDRNNDLLY